MAGGPPAVFSTFCIVTGESTCIHVGCAAAAAAPSGLSGAIGGAPLEPHFDGSSTSTSDGDEEDGHPQAQAVSVAQPQVRFLLELLEFVPVPCPSSLVSASDAFAQYFANGGAGQAYASAKLLEELMVLEMQSRLSEMQARPAGMQSRPSRTTAPALVLEAYPEGTVDTPPSAFVGWSHVPTVTAPEGAAPVVSAVLDDDTAQTASSEHQVPPRSP